MPWERGEWRGSYLSDDELWDVWMYDRDYLFNSPVLESNMKEHYEST